MIINNIIKNIKRYGLMSLIGKISKRFLGFQILDPIQKKRSFLSKEIERITNGKVVKGIYSGTKFINSSHYFLAKSSQLLGSYELEVQNEIYNLSSNFKLAYFINLGAGEGYHSVGSMYKKLFRKCITFEAEKENNKTILKNYEINNIKNFIIQGFADNNFLDKIKNDIELDKSLFLFDIEGSEFDILNYKNLEVLKKSFLIIEIHHFYSNHFNVKKLNEDLNYFYKVKYIKTSSRSLPDLKILNKFNDDEKWLMMSESRPETMQWVVCEPKI